MVESVYRYQFVFGRGMEDQYGKYISSICYRCQSFRLGIDPLVVESGVRRFLGEEFGQQQGGIHTNVGES
eukprot:scaffold16983_cov152-Amphora_coffeaeformis.AAC.3